MLDVYPFRFTGSATEYFRIWIVSMFLTIVTLGSYSAWAKVRKRRYLYGHTWVAESNFDFHGDPVAILRGRLIAVAAFAAYSGLGLVAPRMASVLLLLLAPLGPFLLLRSMRFNTANSSFRNLRFAFRGRYRDAVRAIGPVMIWPLVVILQSDVAVAQAEAVSWPTIGLAFGPVLGFAALYPYMIGSRWRLRIDGTAYGSEAFRCGASLGGFYWLYARAVVLTLACLLLLLLSISGVQAMLAGARDLRWIFIGLAAAWLLVSLVPLAFTRARAANLALGRTRIGDGIRIRSELSALKLAWLYLVNTVAVAGSLGFLVPWAVVRTARYRAGTLALAVTGRLDDVLAAIIQPIGATGDELAGLFDVDLSL